MEEEMGDFFGEQFEADEFDFDYEYDAPKYFDFTRPETYLEALEAELWFESAGSCPPSPFIIKLDWREDISVETTPTKMNSISNNSDDSVGSGVSSEDKNNRVHVSPGLKLYNHKAQYSPKGKTKCLVKSSLSRSSSLMKPTASYLAKQNQPQEIHRNRFLIRFQRFLDKIDDNNESLATKRQKLEAGYLCKVAHLKRQTFLQHKAPTKNGHDARPKVTIPRGPELETANRAERHRSKNIAESGEHAASNMHSFKAHPLNRKILEAPSLPFPRKKTPHLPDFQVFNLKASKRATQQASNNANYNSVSRNEIKDSKRSNPVDALKQEKCEIVPKFKGRPLSPKILSSREETGVFRDIKQETTVPMKFNLPTDKRFQLDPPTELFSKLSLASEAKDNARSQSKMPLPNMDSKENVPRAFHQEHEMINMIKQKSKRFGGKQCRCGNDRMIPKIGALTKINRSLDVR